MTDLDLDEVEADLADVPPEIFAARTTGDGPMRRLIASVPALVAEVRRLRGVADAALAELDRSLEARDRRAEAECDAARAEAERQRERADHNAAAVNENADEIVRLRAEAARLREALQAVRGLHFTHGRNIFGDRVCNECSPLQPMPCPTARALDAALDGAE